MADAEAASGDGGCARGPEQPPPGTSLRPFVALDLRPRVVCSATIYLGSVPWLRAIPSIAEIAVSAHLLRDVGAVCEQYPARPSADRSSCRSEAQLRSAAARPPSSAAAAGAALHDLRAGDSISIPLIRGRAAGSPRHRAHVVLLLYLRKPADLLRGRGRGGDLLERRRLPHLHARRAAAGHGAGHLLSKSRRTLRRRRRRAPGSLGPPP